MTQCRTPLRFLAALLLLTGARSVMAQNVATPYGNEAFEHDSNIFYLPSSTPDPQPDHGGPRRSDEFFRTIIGLDDAYKWGQQSLYATLEGRRLDYLHFTYLDHYENLLRGGLDWKLGGALDGNLEYRHERRMVDFAALLGATPILGAVPVLGTTQLLIETENIATASANLAITPVWRLESSLRDRNLNSPRPGALNLDLHEDTWHEGIRYLGVANLSAGLETEYLWGRFNHDFVDAQPTYHQWTTQVAANYKVTGLTTFSGTAGYTRRSSFGGSDASGFTGSIGYQHFVTGRTEITANLSRAVNSYVSNAGSEVDSTAAVGATYHITYKTSITGAYAWTQNKFPGGTAFVVAGADGALVTQGGLDRTDRVQIATLELHYQMLHWLAVRVYGRYQTRSSNLAEVQYNANAYGIELQARLPQKGADGRR